LHRTDATLTSFTQNRIPVYGAIDLSLEIAGITVTHNYIITDFLDTQFLLGLDFLREKKVILNMERGTLNTQHGSTPFFDKPRNIHKTMKIRCNRTTIIPPNTVQYIRGQIPYHKHSSNYQGITDPYRNTMYNTGLLMASSIVYTDNRTLPIQCINATDEPIVIHKRKLLGFLEPADLGANVHNVRRVTETDTHVPPVQEPHSCIILNNFPSDEW
jgi:hypothetical protein